MSNTSALTEPQVTTPKERTQVEVDPALLAIIKSASAPVAVPKNVAPPKEMPGSTSPITGTRVMLGMIRRGVDAALEYRAKHGDIYRVWFAGTPMVGVWDADIVHQILRNDDKAWSTAMGWDKLLFEGLDDRGNVGGLLGLDFEDHRVARKLVAPGFTTKAVDEYLVTAQRHFAETNAAWVARGHVAFKPEGRALLSRVAGEIFTGIRDPEEMAVLDRALTDFWYVQFAFAKSDWLSPTFRRAKRGLATLIASLTKLMAERRGSDGVDLLSRLCSVEEREGLGDDDVIRLFVNIMAAAFDTTSAGLTSMAYLLARHPEWQDKLRAEAFAVGDRPLDALASREMKFHDLVWKETLRLMPVSTFVPRRALRDVNVGTYRVAAGTMVAAASGAMGRHPAWWTEPSKFDPERFSPERAEDKKHPGIFNPFGGGAHVCIGTQLATMEVKAFWHDLLRRCRVRLTRDYEAHHVVAPLGTVSGDVDLTLEPLRD